MIKTHIRFFENIPVRAVWDESSSKWWFCSMDIAEALTKSKNPVFIGQRLSEETLS